MSDGCRMEVKRTSDGSWTDVGRKSDGSQMQVQRTLNENQMKVRRTSNEQSSTAATTMASGGTTLQLLAMQRCGEADRALQLVTVARPAERCNSLLWRGRQSVATRYCGEAGRALQLAATAMASSIATRDARPIARC